MKHSYNEACHCPRCERERSRRARQSQQDADTHADPWLRRDPRYQGRKRQTRRPRVGSQEWAETRGDDLGESPDR